MILMEKYLCFRIPQWKCSFWNALYILFCLYWVPDFLHMVESPFLLILYHHFHLSFHIIVNNESMSSWMVLSFLNKKLHLACSQKTRTLMCPTWMMVSWRHCWMKRLHTSALKIARERVTCSGWVSPSCIELSGIVSMLIVFFGFCILV